MNSHNIPNYFLEQKAKIPQCWNFDNCVEAVKTLDTEQLYNFSNCKNKLAFSRLMSSVFPLKPGGISYKDYVNTVVEINTLPAKKLSFLELQAKARFERENAPK